MKKSIAVAATILLAGALSFAGSGAANAYPSNCGSAFVANGSTAWCANGPGQIQAVAGCQNFFGFWSTAYGPWVTIPTQAHVNCAWGYTVKWTGFMLRNTN